MTPHEKAVHAINARLERLQANLREAGTETARQFLFQSIIVTIGLSEALNDYVRTMGAYAQRRHGQLKQENDALAAQHDEWMKIGAEWLEKFKASPADKSIRKEIERAQKNMAHVQKSMRRAADTLRRELGPGLAVIDEAAVSIRRLCEATDAPGLKRVVRELIEHVRSLYAATANQKLIAAPAWEEAAFSAIDQAVEFHDAYARSGHQAALALELMAEIWSESPPQNPAELIQRADAATAKRLREIAQRFAKG
jgi:putative component of toxin-antitoxin plasmid stabilization module